MTGRPLDFVERLSSVEQARILGWYVLRGLRALADERIPNCQFREAREVSVGGPELPDTVIET